MVEKLAQAEVFPEPTKGIRLTFTNPELLRAYIQKPPQIRPATLAERISGIRETVLAEFPLDGSLFSSARFTLVVEPDRGDDPRGKRPTAIVRADLQFGSRDSILSKFHSDKVIRKTDVNPVGAIEEAFNNNPEVKESQIIFQEWSKNTIHVRTPLEEGEQNKAFALLQVWDPDIGAGVISISLLSYGRYTDVWVQQYGIKTALDNADEEKGWEVDRQTTADDIDRWDFLNLPVGINCHDPTVFQRSIEFYAKSFPLILQAIYSAEGLTIPNVNLEITPPPIFKQETVTFEDVGGQAQVNEFLRSLAYHAKSGTKLKPIVLAGPSGYGKTSLVQAFATELGGILVKKTSNNLSSGMTVDDVRNFLRASYLEAQAAATSQGGKAVLLLENLEFILGSDGRLHDFLLNEIDNWTTDYSSEVILMITTNAPERIHGGIIDRTTFIPVLPPNREGFKEILRIHIAKIAEIVGRDMFTDLNLDKIAERLRDRNVSGRGTRDLLGGIFSLSRQQGSEITTDSFLALLDLLNPPQRKIGFGQA